MNYKLGSLFDGSGGFPLSGALCGVEPCWAAEVEPYPIAVTRTRFPYMKHLGDISKINGAEIEPIDIITFGSPCQDLSVAGKRAGLKHEANGDEETTRSGLFMEAVRIIKEMRAATNGKYPRFALWENVPGAFSSNKGEDFRIVCEELIKIVEPRAFMPEVPKNGWAYADSYIGDGWSLAYRTFDAQYWGVPQRRRRIHLIADFRGQRAREVLFEREGVRGYFTQGRTPWQTTPADAQGRPGADDREGEGFDGYNGDITGDKSATLGVNCGVSTGRNGVIERGGGLDAVAYSFDSLASNSMKSKNPHSGCRAVDVSKTLDTTDPNPSKNQGGIAIVEPIGFDVYNQAVTGDVTKSLTAKRSDADHTPVVIAIDKESYSCGSGFNRAPGIAVGGPCATLQTSGTPHAVCYEETEQYLFENHSQDTRYKGPLEVAPIVSATYGMGGNNQPFVVESAPVVFDGANVTSPINASNPQPGDPCHTLSTDSRNLLVEPVLCLQGNGIDRADTAGCNGKGWREDAAYTLNTIDRPAVVYAVDQGGGKSSANVTEDKSPTLCTTHGGEPAVAYQDKITIGLNGGRVSPTLISRMSSAVGTTQDNLIVTEHRPPRYIVRRLTPTECARLQGFADRWGDIEKKDSLSPEEYEFWLEVRNTHAAINGKKVQDYTEKQILTWYNKLHTDSAEYKMWGNGIALPPALYCLQGIVDALNSEEDEDDDWLL